MIKTSVVIPNYNGIEYIDECLLSLRNQSYKDFAILVNSHSQCDILEEELLKLLTTFSKIMISFIFQQLQALLQNLMKNEQI